ncbi:polysaccharide biosynthesis/export family protein [Arcticibacter sp. MXS-1]|uniref:polysaccharide biosynthesis/export family protein n=1 Tax=Arcticibacter sp. MXS-1 TaxID=3341726 RepID=UPI0035A9A629
MIRKLSYLKFVLVLFLFSSCISQKRITYFQKNGQPDTMRLVQAFTPKIQPDDILSVYVNSLNPAASSFFNPYSNGVNVQPEDANLLGTTYSASTATRAAQNITPGFRVDEKGMIEIPLVGRLKVAGLTTSQARDTIRVLLKPFLKEPTVNVRFLNFKISVMGEVARPSTYLIPNERITLPEALTMAGDLTIFGKRENVMIMRETNGVKEFATVDLTRRDLFSSPYYYLHPNDVIYVEPSRGRSAQTDRSFANISMIFSGLSIIAILIQTFR